MNMDDIPLWFLFVITTLLVVAAIEVGYQVGNRIRRNSEDEKESPVGAIVGTVLALLVLHANRPIRTDQLIDRLWGESPPADALAALHSHIGHCAKNSEQTPTRPETSAYSATAHGFRGCRRASRPARAHRA